MKATDLLERIRADESMDFQAHKLYYTETELTPLEGGGTRILHNFRVACPFVYGDVAKERCKECAYFDGSSHNGIYCLAAKHLELRAREALKELEVPKQLHGELAKYGGVCRHRRRHNREVARKEAT